MTLRNRFFNWRHKVKHYTGKGCKNVAILEGTFAGYKSRVITKFDWSKPMTYHSKAYFVGNFKGFREGISRQDIFGDGGATRLQS